MSQDSNQHAIHFAHANGFPAGSYHTLFSLFPDTWQVHAVDKFAHDHRFPVVSNWAKQPEELAEYIATQVREPVIGIGHSFGAVITYMTACLFPQWFKGVILIDPPLITGATSWMFRALKSTPLIDKITPAGKAVIRRTWWPKDTDMMAYFKARGLFRGMQDSCIQDYIDSAIVEKDDGLHLAFVASVEANIFRHIPHNLGKFSGKLKCPATLITAANTDVCKPHMVKPFVRANKLDHRIMPDVSHMLPMQNPQLLATWIEEIVRGWQLK